jgi:hypothetical protein
MLVYREHNKKNVDCLEKEEKKKFLSSQFCFEENRAKGI